MDAIEQTTSLWGALGEILGVLAAALFIGMIFGRFRLSVITGYLLVGAVLGPGGIGLIRSEFAQILSELGVVLLLFTIGLEFSWRRFKAFGGIAFLGGGLQVGITALFVTLEAVGFGRPFDAALLLGGAVALSSTAVVLRALMNRGEMDSSSGRATVAILLFQDMAVLILLILAESLEKGAQLPAIGANLVTVLAKAGGLVIGLRIITHFVYPRLLPHAARKEAGEQIVILAIVTALGGAFCAHILGLSPTLGAFLAGMFLGESPLAPQMRADLIPYEALFLTLFFTSIGMVVDMGWVRENLFLTISVLADVIIIKAAIAFVVVYIFRRSVSVASTAGLSLANIGEFAFVLGAIGLSKGNIDADTFQLLVSVAVASMILAPYLMAAASRFAAPLSARMETEAAASGMHGRPPADHILVVGYGPVGRRVVEALEYIGSEVLVIDLNPHALTGGRFTSTAFLFGDACRKEILETAGIRKARALVVTIPDPQTSKLIIALARDLAPDLLIGARATYLLHVEDFIKLGADFVVDGETTTGEELSKRLLIALGLPAECSTGGGEFCRL